MESYETMEIIGRGAFGLIRKVKRKQDGRVLCRKEINFYKMSDREKKQLVAEVNILRGLKHANIVRYYDRILDKENGLIQIIMEFCEGGDLGTMIKKMKKNKTIISEDRIWKILIQLLRALDECHRGAGHKPVLHRDLKPENVFLDKSGNVLLGDFGLSKNLDNPELCFASTYVGTPYYMSPEIVDESNYNTKSDIWALGCLIYELSSLEPPFQAKTQLALSIRIRQGICDELPHPYSKELNSTIKLMLTCQYQMRPSARELLLNDTLLSKIQKYFPSDEISTAVRKSAGIPSQIPVSIINHPAAENSLSTKESDLIKKELKLMEWETLLKAKETELIRREVSIKEKEDSILKENINNLPSDNRWSSRFGAPSGSLFNRHSRNATNTSSKQTRDYSMNGTPRSSYDMSISSTPQPSNANTPLASRMSVVNSPFVTGSPMDVSYYTRDKDTVMESPLRGKNKDDAFKLPFSKEYQKRNSFEEFPSHGRKWPRD